VSKSNTFENSFLKLIFWGTAIPNIADNAASSPLEFLYAALHTADPGEAGTQTTSEATYTSYARVPVARDNTGWSITNNVVNPMATIVFPQCTGGTSNVTHFSIGTAESGAGSILWYGEASPALAVASGIQPQISVNTTITED